MLNVVTQRSIASSKGQVAEAVYMVVVITSRLEDVFKTSSVFIRRLSPGGNHKPHKPQPPTRTKAEKKERKKERKKKKPRKRNKDRKRKKKKERKESIKKKKKEKKKKERERKKLKKTKERENKSGNKEPLPVQERSIWPSLCEHKVPLTHPGCALRLLWISSRPLDRFLMLIE